MAKNGRYEFREVMDLYQDYLNISTNSSYTTKAKYTGIIKRLLLDTQNAYDDLEAINRWISEKNETKNTYNYKFAVKYLFMCLNRKDLLDKLATAKRKPRLKVFNYIDKSTMQKVINALPGVYKKLAFLQFKTGCRYQEVATIRAENIDFNIHDKLIYIKIGVNKSKTKGSKPRSLRLSKTYEALIRAWVTKPYGYLFLDPKYEKVDEKELYTHLDNLRKYYDEELEKAGRAMGVDNLTSHYLRHIFSDHFLRSGGDPMYLQKVLGHSRIETTMGYVSIADKMADEALLRMEEF